MFGQGGGKRVPKKLLSRPFRSLASGKSGGGILRGFSKPGEHVFVVGADMGSTFQRLPAAFCAVRISRLGTLLSCIKNLI